MKNKHQVDKKIEETNVFSEISFEESLEKVKSKSLNVVDNITREGFKNIKKAKVFVGSLMSKNNEI